MCLRNKALLPPPKNLVSIDGNTVSDLLRSSFPRANIYLSDSIYSTTSIDELIRFIKDDKTNEYRYISEYHDCDNYSFELMGKIHSIEWGMLPFGIVWTTTPDGNHAVNCFVDHEYNIYFIEPQNDKIFVCPPDWVPYLIII